MASRAADIIEGARQALAFSKGETDPDAYRVHVPAEVDVRAIRVSLKMSQAVFAQTFGLSVRTVQEWEHGRAKPDAATRAYLRVIERRPDAVREALAA